jgi:hypothetical protein
MTYKIIKTNESMNRLRFKVIRNDNKLITEGCLGYYFDDFYSAEKHLKDLESGKYFKDNKIKEKEHDN